MADYVLGISAFYHDSAAALVKDGLPVAASQEERFSRVRHDRGFPKQAIAYCLDAENVTLNDVSKVVYYENADLKYQRILSSFRSAGLAGLRSFRAIIPQWWSWKRRMNDHVRSELNSLNVGRVEEVHTLPHHHSHAASAFYPSPFESAAVLCIDGVGEWDTTTIWHGVQNDLNFVNSIRYPHSLGLLYSAFTYYCGFKVDSGEYKLMGLAPYGTPVYADIIRNELINLRPDGSYSLNMDYFEFLQGERMVGQAFERLFDRPRRESETAVTQMDCDLAASVQKVTEEAVLGLAKSALEQTGESRLCMAGGVALNCVANGVLSRSGMYSDIWIQPAAGDAGCALGAALELTARTSRRPHLSKNTTSSARDSMNGALLGPSFSNDRIEAFVQANALPGTYIDDAELFDTVASHLENGNVVGWFQGRMEYGPRALGARSIIADPRNIEMQKQLNLKIKFRESFRPFAPACLEEDTKDYFDLRHDSPYMLLVANVHEHLRHHNENATGLGEINAVRSTLPAITHVDYSARVQTVSRLSNKRFYELLKAFKRATGCSVLVNTSFNVRGEPIVLSPEHAYTCFMRTNMDVLVLENYVFYKKDQPDFKEDQDWREEIPLD